ncbi:MAG: hypothetical protein QM504_13310, partial [Pseudomonadota bacterium]
MLHNKSLITFLDKCYQHFFYIAYRLKLIVNFIYRPTVSGVYIAVWFQGKILIIKNSYKNYYTLPCGGVKNKET